MKRPEFAIITTCMGRLMHLRQSLPRFVDQEFKDYLVYVVDWSSPDGLREWMEQENPARTRLVRVVGQKYFNLSAARNAGGRQACRDGAGLLAFIDADILIPGDFLSRNWERAQSARDLYGDRFFLQTRELIENGNKDPAVWGSCIVPAATWKTHEYNERIESYGMEDNELYSLWVESGVAHLEMYVQGIRSIPHSDEDRMRYYREGPRDIERLKRENKSFFRGTNKDLF